MKFASFRSKLGKLARKHNEMCKSGAGAGGALPDYLKKYQWLTNHIDGLEKPAHRSNNDVSIFYRPIVLC